MAKKRVYRNYKNRTPKQIAAHKRNFAIFRLRGMEASLKSIVQDVSNNLRPGVSDAVYEAYTKVQWALHLETGK